MCATSAGPGRYAPARGLGQPHRTTATPLPSRWLHELTARVGTGVGRLLAIARRELTAALVPVGGDQPFEKTSAGGNRPFER